MGMIECGAWSPGVACDGGPGEPVALRESAEAGGRDPGDRRAEGGGDVQAGHPPGLRRAEAAGLEGGDPGRVRGAGRGRGQARAGPAVAVRQVEQAAATINGEVRPSTSALRPEVATLVADRREALGRGRQPGRAAHPVRAGAGPGAGRPAGARVAPARPGRWPSATAGPSATWPPGTSAATTPWRPTRLEATLEAVDDGLGPGPAPGDDPGRGAGRRGVDGLRRVVHLRPARRTGSTG